MTIKTVHDLKRDKEFLMIENSAIIIIINLILILRTLHKNDQMRITCKYLHPSVIYIKNKST